MKESNFLIIAGLIIIFGVVLMVGMYKHTKYLSGVIKTEIFILRTAVQSNSCFHLMIPGGDNESAHKKKNRKSNPRRNKSGNKKTKNISG